MSNGPRGNVCGDVQEILDEAKILLFALDSPAKPPSPGSLHITPKIIAALQPLFAPNEKGLLPRLWIYRDRQSQKQQVSVGAFGNKSMHVLVGCFAAQRVVVRGRQGFHEQPE